MDFFDILLAKKLENDKDVSIVQLNVSENGTYSESGKAYSPVVVDVQPPSNSYLRTPIDSYPTTAEQLPIPKCDVEIVNQKSCKVFVSNKPFVNDKTPYIYRKSAGGDRVYEKLIGGTIAWNQLCPIRSDFSGNGITLTSNSDGSYNVNGTAEAVTVITFGSTFTVYQNHKYYIKGCPSDGGSNKYYFGLAGYVSETGSGAIFNYPSATSKQNARLDVKSGANISNAKIIPQVIDLTQMFGSTIADYIYSLEQATAGAGVAWFRALFPNDYYAYDTGSLQSVNVASKKVVGFNQLNLTNYTNGKVINGANGNEVTSPTYSHTDFIPVLPNTIYYGNQYIPKIASQWGGGFYDSNKNFIGGISKDGTTYLFTTPSNCYYVKMNVDTAHREEACLNISNPSKNGTYEPYEEHTYAFDSDITLRGIPKLDASNNLYYDGDVYESDGTVTRRYGIVDLGTLDYERNTSYDNPFFYAIIDGIGRVSPLKPKINIFCSERYLVVDSTSMNSFGASADNNTICKEIGAARKKILIRDDSYTDAQAFKTAMNGVYLVYELATPTTESADAYINPQMVDADGTEEFVDYGVEQETRDVAVPVGHESLYYNGQLYQTDFEQATTDTINMAELHSIVPPRGEFYMTANGTLSVDAWKK